MRPSPFPLPLPRRAGALRWSPTQKSGDIVVSENRMTASYRASAAANKWNTVLAENYVKAYVHTP
jgi:hypothetical protein